MEPSMADNTVSRETIENDPMVRTALCAAKAAAATSPWIPGEAAAAILGMSLRQLQRGQEDGLNLRRKRFGREIRYHRDEIEDLKARMPPKWSHAKLAKMSPQSATACIG
jgi:hypothetical protein